MIQEVGGQLGVWWSAWSAGYGFTTATGSGPCFGCCTVTNWRCLPQDWFSMHVSFFHVWCCSFPIKQSVSELVQLESYRTPPNIFGPKVWKPTGSVKCSPCVNEFVLTAPRHHHGLWLLLLRVTTYNLTYVDFTIFISGECVVCFY